MRRTFSLGYLLSVCAAFFSCCDCAVKAEAAELDDVLKGWEVRSKQVVSGRFEWSEDAVHTITPIGGLAVGVTDNKKNFRDERSILIFEESKFRYESVGFTSKKSYHGKLVKRISAFNGELTQILNPKGVVPNDRGYINSAANFGDVFSLPLRGLMIAFRPLETTDLGRRKGRMRLLDASVDIDGRDVRVLEKDIDDSELSDTFKLVVYVDTERDHIPLRYTELVGGQLAVQVDIGYTQDSNEGWVPSHWNCVMLSGSKDIRFASKGKVLSYSINEDFPESTFEIDFPVGTLVTDGRQDNRLFRKMENGSLAHYHPTELKEFQRNWWLILANAAIVLILFSYFLRRRGWLK